jgi:protocatechuate 3,4-dioxygenase beta subunit
MRNDDVDVIRRRLIQGLLAIPAGTILGCGSASGSGSASPSSPTSLQPTPACDDGDDDPTPAQTEGPYFKPNSPERSSLVEAGLTGTRLTITGRVLSTSCQPIARALLDFWHADDSGNYDNVGFRLRGHQFTDEDGRFTLETMIPGLYPGRTRHIHVKAQAPNQSILTTQLYFPGEPRNTSDSLYMPALQMNVQQGAGGSAATFDFVLRT